VGESWLHLQEVLGRNDLPRSGYETELKRARAMARWFPSAPMSRLNLALALYRTGAYRQVLETRDGVSAGVPPAYPAVLAMASLRLQQPEKAKEFLADAKRLLKSQPVNDEYSALVIAEAEKIVDAGR
jgi:hypothetical protein